MSPLRDQIPAFRRGVRSILTIPLTVAVTALALLAFAFPTIEATLSIDLLQPKDVKGYQLAGCHLLHWSAEHLLWDIGMFCILGVLCERCWPKRYYAAVGLSAIVIPLVILFCQPEISTYRGLSGIDTAIFALAATMMLRESARNRDWLLALLSGGLLIGLAGKIGYEFLSHGLLFVSELNFIPLPLAHLAGGAVGAIIAALPRGR